MKNLIKTSHSDEGAALALVLIMVTFLSLWIGSVAFLTQSSNTTIRMSIQESNRRSDIINSGIGQVLNAVTKQDKRFGIAPINGTFPCEDSGLIESDGGIFTSEVDGNIKIACTQSPQSGVNAAIASYVLTGTSCAPRTRCDLGIDAGLNLSSPASSACSTTSFNSTVTSSQLSISGGIINSSGAWNGINCVNMFLGKVGGLSRIQQPSSSDATCPGITLAFTASTSGKPNFCTCPLVSAEYSSSTNPCVPDISYSDLNPAGNNDLRSYLDNQATLLKSAPTNPATYTGSCTTTGMNWSPGVIDESLLTVLNTEVAKNCTKPIVFSTGVYKFSTNLSACGTACLLSVPGSNSYTVALIGGTPDSSGTNCDPSKPGVQFQFTYPFRVELKGGVLALCSLENSPVIAAPLQGSPANFNWSGDWSAFPFLKIVNATFSPKIFLFGQIFAPAGYADISLNDSASIAFNSGAIFRAMTISLTGNVKSISSVAPPPPFNGDRIVQLRFFDTLRNQDLGVVQVVIKDFYGRRYASGYQILTWRAGW